MNISILSRLLEIRNKIIIVIPYLLGTTLAISKYNRFNLYNAVLYFCLMILFNASTTLLKNYNSLKKNKENKKRKIKRTELEEFLYSQNINMLHFKILIFIMFLMSGVISIVLALNTDRFLLIIEILCFALGLAYSLGTMPLSSTPFGEFTIGITKGLMVPLMSLYIHVYDQNLIKIIVDGEVIRLNANFMFLLESLTIFLPCAGSIFNIMLAQNMITIRKDIKNRRYTLPVSIGKRKSYKLYKVIYYICYCCIPIGIAFGVLAPISLISIITLKHIKISIKKFRSMKNEKEAFYLSMKNFLLINLVYILILVI